MNRNKLKKNLLWFCFTFILLFLMMKFTGGLGRTFHGSISFKETIARIPEILVFSVFAFIIFSLVNRETQKSEKKSIEMARKRLEEKEKKENEEKNTPVQSDM
ncbi:MAG: hypothetical protein ACOYMD_09705 [Paludibacter sp.]